MNTLQCWSEYTHVLMASICPCIPTLHLFHLLWAPIHLYAPIFSTIPLPPGFHLVHPVESSRRSEAGRRVKFGYLFPWLPPRLAVTHVWGSWFLSGGVSAYSSRTLYAQIRSQGGDRGKPAQNMATNSLTFLSSRCGVYVLSPWKWVGSATTRNNKTWQKWHCFSAQTGSFYLGMLRQNCSGRRRPPLKAFLTLHRSLGHSGQPLPPPFTRGQVCIAVWQLPQPSPPCFLFSLSQALPLIKSLHI